MAKLPKASLSLEWIYGYRGHQCRNNLVYAGGGSGGDGSGSGCVVYFVAGVGVVFDTEKRLQRFYLGHDDDIISLALHPDSTHVATGQVGKTPRVNVWNCLTLDTAAILKDGHQHGVSAVAFSPDGLRLLSVGSDQQSTIVLWDWKKGRLLSTTRGHSDKIFDVQFTPKRHQNEFLFATCGIKHIKFWKHSGNTLTSKKGIFGKAGEIQTMMSLAFCGGGGDSSSGGGGGSTTNDSLTTYSVTLSGDAYVWSGSRLIQVVRGIHEGAVYSIISYDACLVTGGKDSKVKIWDSKMQAIKSFDLANPDLGGYEELTIRSLNWSPRNQYKILVGTKDSEIIEVVVNGDQRVSREWAIMEGHSEGELWALACHSSIFVTGSDDRSVRLWDRKKKRMMMMRKMDAAVRSCAIDADAAVVAVGMVDGSFVVLSAKDFQPLKTIKSRKEVIHEMKFSPDGSYLAVGSNDNYVDIYDCRNSYKKLGTCAGSSSFITHIDWSSNGKYLLTNSGASERLVFAAPGGKQVTNSGELSQITWHTMTGVLENEVKGVWPKYSSVNDVNACDVYRDKRVADDDDGVVVTADDFGLVKLFKYPCVERGAKAKEYIGHSAHVTNIRFSLDGQSVISVGGADHAIFQWRYRNADDDGALDDDLEAEKDTTPLPVDSDVERDNERNYNRLLDKAEVVELQKQNRKKVKRKPPLANKPANQNGKIFRPISSHGSSNRPMVVANECDDAPDDSLELVHAFGYRGFDGRNNVHYLKSNHNDSSNHNSRIVYHTAAVAVVMQLATKKQQFYLGHDDDILSLTTHPTRNVIATGQIGKNPPIHVWDAESLKVLSILKEHHCRGVCSLDFTKDGKKLASVGLDENHCIVVWDWKKGTLLASTRGHKDLIYSIKWNPHDDNRLVTIGNKHIQFWIQAGNGFTSKRGIFGKVSPAETVMCVSYGGDVTSCFSGGVKGVVHCWGGEGGNVLLRAVQAHQGPVFTMVSSDGVTFITAGKDALAIIWRNEFKQKQKTINIDRSKFKNENDMNIESKEPFSCVIRSADTRSNGEFLLVGTKESEILEYDLIGQKVAVVMQGHKEGELWGLACHPTKMYAATTSEDATLRIWSLGEKAAMVALCRLDKPSRCVEFNHDGKLLAVGMTDGSVVVLETATLTVKQKLKRRKQNISDIKFSPNQGKYMVVGSHDNFVDVYNASKDFECVAVCKSASSYITHVDYDVEGKLIQVNTGAKEILHFEVPSGSRLTPSQAESVAIDWSTWTSVLGQWCEGIWPPCSDVTDVNASCLTKDKKLLATGDDFGFVKLFKFPAKVTHAKHKRYVGHSAHVTNVRWCSDDQTLLSVGGADGSLLVWKRLSRSSGESGQPIEAIGMRSSSRLEKTGLFEGASGDGSSVGSVRININKSSAIQSDDSDSDDDEESKGVGGYDSDIDEELKIDYVSKFNVNPLRYKQDNENNNNKNNNNENDLNNNNKKTFNTDYNGRADKGMMLGQMMSGRMARKEVGDLSAVDENYFVESIRNMYSRKLKPQTSRDQPKGPSIETLELESAFGYRGYDSRNNVHYLDEEEIVYPAAATAVVAALATGQQRFYLGHNDDIICLVTNQNPRFKNVIATGEIGEKPAINVWNCKTMLTLSVLSGCLEEGVRVLDFSCSGRLLVAAGMGAEKKVVVYDWQEGIHLATSSSVRNPLYHLEYRPDSDRTFVSVGLQNIHFWTLAGNTLVRKRGSMAACRGLNPNRKMTFLSLAFGMNDVTYSGGITGDVYVWRGTELERVIEAAHSGPIISMHTSLFDGLIVSAGKERNDSENGNVKLWDQEMKKSKSFQLPKHHSNHKATIVKSVSRIRGKIIVGTKDNTLQEIKEKSGDVRLVLSCHGDGQLWGLATHPRDADVIATSGDDGKLIVWNLKEKKPLTTINIGASRSVDFNSNGDWLAIGHVDGSFQILSTNQSYRPICKKRFRGSCVSVIKFTPDDNFIISACKENFVDLYKVNNNQNNIDVYRVVSCTLNDVMAFSIDVTKESKYIKVGTSAYTNKFFSLPNLHEVSPDEVNPSTFHQYTSLSDDEVKGSWPSNQTTNHHINCCHVTNARDHVVTGDDYGMLKLFKYPASERNAHYKHLIGHSAHVTNIRVTCDDARVASTGGDDSCVFVWRCVRK